MPLGLPPLLPGYQAAGPSADFMRRRTMGMAARNAIGAATAGGGGLAGARAGAQMAHQGSIDAGFQASQLQAQEAQQEAARRQQYMNEQSGLSRGLLSGLGGALGAVGSSEGSTGQQIMGLAGSLAPLLLASDRRLKSALRGASSEVIEAARQFILQLRNRPERRTGMGDVRHADAALSRPRSLDEGGTGQQPVQDAAARALLARRARGATDTTNSRQVLSEARRTTAAGTPGPTEPVAGSAATMAPGRITAADGSNLSVQQARSLGRTVPPRTFRGPNGPVGVVAQDVERAAPGMVRRVGPAGIRAIDIPQATGTLLAGHSDLSQRVQQLESLLRNRRGR